MKAQAKKKIWISQFEQVFDTTPKGSMLTLNTLAGVLTRCVERTEKIGPMINFARFGQVRNDKEHLRHNGNLLGLSGLVVDIDCKQSTPMTKDEIQRRLGDIFYIAHTTHSSTPKHPRWHVFIPFAAEVDQDHYRAGFENINRRLGQKLDNVSKGASTPYFLPMCPPGRLGDFQAFIHQGELFDPSKLTITPVKSGPKPRAKKQRKGDVKHASDVQLPVVELSQLKVPETLLELIRSGDAHDFEQDRSRLSYYVIDELIIRGLSDLQIGALLLDPQHGISERHRDKGQAWTLAEIARVREKLAKQRLVEGIKPHYPVRHPKSARQASRSLKRLIAKFFESGKSSVGLRAPAGLGKSTGVCEHIAQRNSGQGMIEIYVPTHKLGRQLKRVLHTLAPHLVITQILGRTYQRRRRDQPLCKRSQDVIKLNQRGLNIYSSLCGNGQERCIHFHNCRYLAQFQKPTDVRILTHGHLGLKRSRLEGQRPVMAIIDETFWPAMIKTHSYRLKDLRGSEIQSSKLRKGLVTALSKGEPLLAALRRRLGGQAPLLAALEREIEWLDQQETEITPSLSSALLTHRLKNSCNLNLERQVIDALRAEAQQFPDREGSLSVRPGRTGQFVVNQRLSITRFNIPKHELEAIPVLYIDADLIRPATRVYFPDMQFQRIDVDRKASVIQCHSTRNSKQRYCSDHENYQADIAAHTVATQRFLDKICKDQKVLVVSYEKLVGNPKKGIPTKLSVPKHCAMEHFGNLRGIDKYKDFDACVIIGRHQFPSAVLENMAACLWWDSDKPLHLTGCLDEQLRGYRLREGHYGVHVPVHSDARVQLLQQQLREGETLQAIDRLRLIHGKQPKPVYILSNLPLPITVDQLASWKELTSTAGHLDRLSACYPDGVIPLSPKYLHDCHGDIFRTVDMAKKWVQRLRNGRGHTHIPAGCFKSDNFHIINTISNGHFLTYKVQSQRGKPKLCLCLLPIPKSQVARRLGEIHGARVTILGK